MERAMEISLPQWLAAQRNRLGDSAVLLRMTQEKLEESQRNLDRLESAFRSMTANPAEEPPRGPSMAAKTHKGGWPKGKSRKPQPDLPSSKE